MKNKYLGKFWNDKKLDIYKIEDKNIVINENHWNGEVYSECFELDEDLIEIIHKGIEVKPIYQEKEDGDFKLIEYVLI